MELSYFSIVSDASCDLNAALRSRFEIDALIYSQILFPDGHSETVDTDWGNITPDAYFGSMVDKKLRYQSSSPGPENAKRVFRAELEKGNDVLCVTLSSGMSAIYEHCLIAKEELASEFPDRTICILDSKRYSTASGLLCILASKHRAEGKSITETVELLENYSKRIHQSGWMDDLFFLARAGRLSKGTAFMGTMIGVKPIADFNLNTGMFQVIGKARGANNALRAVVDYVKATIENPAEQIVFVAHTLRKEYADRLGQMIQEEIGPKEVLVNWVGQTSGANIGPGLVATFYLGKPLSEELVEETEILKSILK
ncbi:MAG: DegV family protein [Clostridia bacterium]|nr:DegV family protein [Clostridia bacterium]